MNLKPRSKVRTDFSMSSMTDLIFLLLIFFIITSTMVNPNAIKVLLPQGKVQTNAPNPIEVAIDASTKLYVMNKEVSYEGLEQALLKELNGQKPEEASIALSADKSVPLEFVTQVMATAQRMKMRMIIRTGRN